MQSAFFVAYFSDPHPFFTRIFCIFTLFFCDFTRFFIRSPPRGVESAVPSGVPITERRCLYNK